jgi:hypothetical protein
LALFSAFVINPGKNENKSNSKGLVSLSSFLILCHLFNIACHKIYYLKIMPPEEKINETNEAGVDVADATPENSHIMISESANPLNIDLPARERMLDVFPVSEGELDRILLGYKHYVSGSATFASFHSQPFDRVQHVEETFLPESSLLIQAAFENVFLIGTGYDDSDQFKFIEAMSGLLGRRGARTVLQILHTAAGSSSVRTVQPETLTSLVHRLILASSFLKTSQPENVRPAPQAWTASLKERVRSQEDGVTLAIWTEWVNSIAPQVYQALSTLVHYAMFTPDHAFRQGSQPLQFPKMKHQESALWTHSYQTAPSSLALLSPCLGADWASLYSSDFDGFSFSTFQQALLSYQGATVILIQTESGDAFGFYTDCPWKESRHWYGHHAESFLFTLKPTLRFYGPVGEKQFNMYLNNPLSLRPGDLTGLAIGGINGNSPRLHIPPTFEQCKAGSMDGTYASGPMLSNWEVFFNIDVIEVWAITGSEDEFMNALQAGKAQADIREGNRIKAATVDRKQFLDDFQSGAYINSIFAHRRESRGRHSFCADDDGKGYFIEEKQPSFCADDDCKGYFIEEKQPTPYKDSSGPKT